MAKKSHNQSTTVLRYIPCFNCFSESFGEKEKLKEQYFKDLGLHVCPNVEVGRHSVK